MYRHKTVPSYSNMRIICGNEATTRKTLPSCRPTLKKGASEKNTNGEAMPVLNRSGAYEKALCSGGIKNLGEKKKRVQPELTPTLQPSMKERRTDDSVADALAEMAAAVSSLTKRETKEEKSMSMETVIQALQTIPDMDDDLLLDACDFLEDGRRARMFLALDSTLRKKWLIRKLRSPQL